MANVRSALLLHLGLVLGVILTLTSSTSAEVIYQIWPRSFQDTNADGSGDIQGIINHLDHFVDLGIDVIWLNSIYTSPLANSGNDVSNFTGVNSLYGTLDDFDALLLAAHDQGLKVIIDFIPNHSSDQHPWFNASVYSVAPYTDYYIWSNGTVNGTISVPSNWESSLNSAGEGSAWEWNSIRQQYYLHQYSVNEPDLNLRNEAVIQELLDVLDFWLNRGVDGFYVNGVSYFLENTNFTDNPNGSTIYSYGLADNVDLLYTFRAHIDSWVQTNNHESKLLFAEGFESQENLLNYYGNSNYSGIPAVNVDFMSTFSSSSNASYIASVLNSWLSLVPSNESVNWKLSNQDYSRISTRYGLNRADGLNMLALSLPGNAFTYYGEEIAMMDNEDITYAETVDPIALAAGETAYASVSRDPYRTPMQWDTTSNAGFTTTASPYLPLHSNYATRNVYTQTEADSSNYNTYKATVALRSKPAFTNGSYELVSLNSDRVLVLRRYLEGYPTYILAINLGLARRTVNLTEAFSDLPSELYIRVRSNSAVFSESTVATNEFVLTANAAVMLSDEEERINGTAAGNVTTELDWHQTATIYQIYTKSFQDSDGNGVGDIQGIISRLSYISETGWTGFSLTPFYPSPQLDGGYDITNFVGVDPLFGSLVDFQELVKSAHEKKLKIILDFVPNHSSNQHSWFQNSVARVEPYTNYYVWSDGVTSNSTNVIQPPNNWLSVFGGSAWTWNAQRQQYYLHQFHTSQPDLNLRNPAVIAELTAVLQFWLNQGVDGFRISASAHLFENADLPDEPVNENAGPDVLETDHEYLDHIHTTDQNENFNLVYHWRSVVDEYVEQTRGDTKILITDSRANRDVVVRYFGNTTHAGAHVSLNYGLIANLSAASNAAEFVEETQQWLSFLPENQTSSTILGNHDYSRVASRFALNRVDGLNILILLPGIAFTYMGEELGLLDASISYDDTQDPLGLNAGPNRYQLFSRDPARTPFHWNDSTSAGFSTNASTWLPVNTNYMFRNLALQFDVDRSMYQTYKNLLEIKKTETIKRGSTSFQSLNNGQAFAFLRQLNGYESYTVLINLGITRLAVDIAPFTQLMRQPVKVCLASANAVIPTEDEIDTNEIILTANAAVVLCDKDTDAVTTTSAPIVTSPTENVTSPTVNVTSPTENVTSPTENVTSPTENVTSPTVNVTSPTVNVTSPTENVTSPTENVTSPTVNVTSPTVNVTSPTENVTSPTENVTSPTVNVTSPTENVTSPTENVTSPTENVTSPTVNVTSPTVNVTSPTVNVTSPTENVTSPTVNVTSPTENVTSPTESVTSPTVNVTSPTENVTSPTENVTSPTENVTSPTENVTSPTVNVTSPTENVTSPTENVTSPTVNVTSPTVNVTSPTVNVTSPTENVTSPTENVTSPTVNVTSPTENVTSPTVNVTSPTENVTSPTENVTSPTVNVTSPTQNVTSSTPIETTTDPTVVDGPILGNNEISGVLEWWQTASVYQIYPKSYQDSDGNGIGDLEGIISRLNHLRDTGVDTIWLNSIFESPQVDDGFDISNFTNVDPIFGNFTVFQSLVQQAHARGIKIILDFVPNHSSDQHLWFQNSVARIEPYTSYYVWSDGVSSNSTNVTQPPNNWLSVFGGSAWTWNAQRQQYYLHQFHSSQPDLNLRNPAVVAELTTVLQFWLGRGVDGFRISAVAHLFENTELLDEPINENAGPNVLETDYEYLIHNHTTDLNETFDLVYHWRAVVDAWVQQSGGDTKILITDSAGSPDVVSRYFGNQTNQGAHIPFNFGIISGINQTSTASDYIKTAVKWVENSPIGQTSNWILGNHDQNRIASRLGANRVDGLNMLKLLPGPEFTYMGEEIALLDTRISFEDTQDPHALNAGPDRFQIFTRDPARTPYHWANTTSAGFSTNTSTWLPVNPNFITRNLAVQSAANRSNYQTYKSLLELRKTKTIKRGATYFRALNNDSVLSFVRTLQNETIYAIAINLGLATVHVDLSIFPDLPTQGIRVCLSSSNAVIETGTVVNITSVSLSANAAVVLCNSELPEATTTVPTPSPNATTTTTATTPTTTADTTTVTPATTTTVQTTTVGTTTTTSPTPSNEPILVNSAILGELSWWQTASVYQIYPKSFQDTNGDGIGDLQGIISRLDHLKETGTDAIFLNSVLPSPQVDGGYDVLDYLFVDPIFGSQAVFQQLIEEAHSREIKVIFDFVPNHSSDQNLWFKLSVEREEPFVDFYVWHDGIPSANGTSPPNNWLSVFGGSAWTWNERRQQYYLHQFHTSQPDYNYRNPTVINEMTNALRFWLGQGVDGFRLSAVAHLFENANLLDEPVDENAGPNVWDTDHAHLNHIYTSDQNETFDMVYQWRAIIDDWTQQAGGDTRILITDSHASQHVSSRYFGNGTRLGAHVALNFGLISNLNQASLASDYVNTVVEWSDNLPQNQSSNWILGTHDHGRTASRFRFNLVDGLNLFHLLPGTSFTYMGEELGLMNTAISFADTQDPHAINAGLDRFELFTRDPARTPYHWNNSTSAGFSTNSTTWLPVNSNYVIRNLAVQMAVERSNYQTYKDILKLRRTETIKRGATRILALNNNNVVAFSRELPGDDVYVVLINLGLPPTSVNISAFTGLPSGGLRVCVASANAIITPGTAVNTTSIPLSANAAVVLCNSELPDATTTVPTPSPNATTTTTATTPTTTADTTTVTPATTTTVQTTTVGTTTTTSPTPSNEPILVNSAILGELSWWQTASVYQIYPKSFQDTNGDGIGDLQGIISRLDHLQETGTDAILLKSVLASPQVDGGYDVSDYLFVDPIFGSQADFQQLIEEAHSRGIKVIFDFVPNHSSDQNLWFKLSVEREEPFVDFYVWHDGIPSANGTSPPNNWLSVFGGSAWTWNERRQQYYLHQFHTSQPDYNYRNPTVINEMTNSLRFWLGQGVDGFRLSAVAHLFENANLLDEPVDENAGPNVWDTDHAHLNHIYTSDQNETFDMVYQWRAIIDDWTQQAGGDTRILITDSHASQHVSSRYYGNATHLGAHVALNFGVISNLTQASLASDYVNIAVECFDNLPQNQSSNWILGTHDHGRTASRFLLNRVDGLNMLHLLPGTSFTYMGEELGLMNTAISFADTQDPHAINAGPDRFELFTRDPARTPYHWNYSTSAGFSTNSTTWLPVNSNYVIRNLAVQMAVERSNYQTYKDILKLRRTETIKRGATRILALNNNNVVAFSRELPGDHFYAVAINLGLLTISVNMSAFTGLPSEGLRVCVASANSILAPGTAVDITSISLSANAAVVICDSEIPETTTSTPTPAVTPTPTETTLTTTTTPNTTTSTPDTTTFTPDTTTFTPDTTTFTPDTTTTTPDTTTADTTLTTIDTTRDTTITTPPTTTPDNESETEDSVDADDGATTIYLSSVLLVISLWSIVF